LSKTPAFAGRAELRLDGVSPATSIIVTHDRTLAFSLADRVAMIFDGQILFIGTPEEVKRQSEPRIHNFIYAELPNSKSPHMP
jgi:phospholipid/cholesterol/gamma-HCH transport system ATP-binding protein